MNKSIECTEDIYCGSILGGHVHYSVIHIIMHVIGFSIKASYFFVNKVFAILFSAKRLHDAS